MSLVFNFCYVTLPTRRYSGCNLFFYCGHVSQTPILCDDPVRAALREAVKTVQSRHPFSINAWVLLPDHLHTIWTLPTGDADYAMRWSSIKRRVSLACAELYHRTDWMTASQRKHRESTFWQRRYWEHCINSESDYVRHRDYIAINPVKHGWVSRAQDLPIGHKGLIRLFTVILQAVSILWIGPDVPI